MPVKSKSSDKLAEKDKDLCTQDSVSTDQVGGVSDVPCMP